MHACSNEAVIRLLAITLHPFQYKAHCSTTGLLQVFEMSSYKAQSDQFPTRTTTLCSQSRAERVWGEGLGEGLRGWEARDDLQFRHDVRHPGAGCEDQLVRCVLPPVGIYSHDTTQGVRFPGLDFLTRVELSAM